MRIVYSHPAYGTKNFLSSTDRVVIGRQKADLDLTPDLQVSQQHARITAEKDGFWVEDLGSLNGTLVNGVEIKQKTKLGARDSVTIGETDLKVELEQEDSAAKGERFKTVRATDARQRLSVFHEIGAAFTSAEALEPLLTKLVEQLLRAIPTAQGGGLLLREKQGQLLLKAHIPEGQPSASLSLSQQAIDKKEAFIWKRKTGTQTSVAGSIVRSETQCALYAPLLVKDEVLGVVYVDSAVDVNAFNDEDLYVLLTLSYQAAMVVKYQSVQKALRDETALRADILRWFSPKIAKRLTDRHKTMWSGGERVQATILCSDVRGFTAMARKMEPSQVVKALNESFEVLIPIVFKYDGTVDKYVGDSILAVFGTPEPDENQWEHAVRAAVEMQAVMGDLSKIWKAQGREPFEIGIGIETGEILHGVIGAQDRLEYTVIGDPVNRAARFCDGAGRGETVISKDVYARVFRLVDVSAKSVATKHADTEGMLQGYLIKGLK